MRQLNNNRLVKACRALGIIQVRTRVNEDGHELTQSRLNPWHPVVYIMLLIDSVGPYFIQDMKRLKKYLTWKNTKMRASKKA
jgi:hypothetical protein